MKRNTDKLSWANLLSVNFSDGLLLQQPQGRDNLMISAVRARLVARARWFLLFFFTVYGLVAGSSFYFSQYGFFLSPNQLVVLILSIAAVICYNNLYHFHFDRIIHIPMVNHLQVVLDFLFVTILIHMSGGAASWFWPVYLIVTIEAAFLLDRSRDVWLLGAAGGVLYGALLIMENFNLLLNAHMPFVDTQLHHDGLYLFLMAVWVAILNAATAVIANFLMSVIRREARLLRESEERLLSFLDSANDLIHCNDVNGKFLYCNQAMQSAVGLTREDMEGGSIGGLLPSELRDEFEAEVRKVLAEGKSATLESVFAGRDGREINVEGSVTCSVREGESPVVWGIWRDISERKQSQAKLYNLAHHDNLTALPNRILFIDRLKQAMAMAHRAQKKAALLFLDLDRFKNINDTLGHPTGDRLLQSVARRLTTSVREVDSVSRFGGDEYTIVLVNLEHRDDAEKVAKKVLAALAKPYQVDSHELYVTASIGISMYPQDSEDLDNLIKKADIAMYHAKGQGGDRYLVYDPAMDEHSHKRLVLENSMRKALDLNEFRLHYQPKVDILSGRITSVEALLRWEHPEFGLVGPTEFIPLAEETGLIIPIGEWVIERACLQNLEWQQQGLPRMRVAVNLSGYQLQQANFLERVKEILHRTGMPAEQLEFEITETVIMQNPEVVIQLLNVLREMGIHISVDDFGTGYSSLAHLKRFSVNTLKIDKSFVRDVVSNQTDAAIATAIIAMGNSLNLTVVAEGVETEGQFNFLQETMCDEVQGYLVSKPLPPEKVVEFMRTRGLNGNPHIRPADFFFR